MPKLKATLEQDGPSTSKASVRSHTVFVDRPIAKGGADRGPVGGEYILVGLAGCFTSHLLAAIRAREAPVSGVMVTANGTLEGNPERFTQFELAVSVREGDSETVHKLVEIAERACQVVNTLKQCAPVVVTVVEPARV